MSITELTPLSLGELLDRSFNHYRKHFWLFVGIAALPEVAVIVAYLFLSAVQRAQLTRPYPQDPAVIRSQMPHLAAGFLAVFLLIIVVSLVCHAVTLGGITFAVSDVCLGRSSGIGKVYHRLRGKLSKLIGLLLLFGLIMAGAYLLAMIGVLAVAGIAALALHGLVALRPIATVGVAVFAGIVAVGLIAFVSILVLRLALAIPALMLEEVGPGQALKRSFRLTKGSWWRLFLIVVLGVVIEVVAAFVFQVPFWVAGVTMGFKVIAMPLWLAAPTTILGGVGAAVGGPLLFVALVLFYYDARIRREGFDLQLMMTSLDGKTSTPPLPPNLNPDYS